MIKGQRPGANITLMNTLSWRGRQCDFNHSDPSNEKFSEFLTLIYKDADTGLKYCEELIDPNYEYYMAKENSRVNYNRLFIPRDEAEAIVVPHKDLEKDIAIRVGYKDFYFDNIRNGNRSQNKTLHLHPDVFNSDMNIQDHYMLRFSKEYKNEPGPITKSFFDIEADTIHMIGDFPQPGECPINAVSLILQQQKQIYIFLLRNKANPQIAKFEEEVKKGNIFTEINDFVINAVGGPAMADKYKTYFRYSFLFYDEDKEINLIKDLFSAINTFKPDFALAWNMGFDVPYIIARIQNLGFNPADIMCHSDFKYKIAEYYIDERNKSDFAERGDFAQISSYTTFLDQMIHFASRRKGQSKLISFTLDYIGENIAKVRKLDYKHITTNIAELPYKDYKTFVFYNVMDTIVQYCIEMVTGDIDYVFTKSNMNCTRYCKTHRQTVYLTNRVTKDISKDGFIIGNNCNKFNDKPTEKFPGAFVADPLQLSNHPKLCVLGRYINCCDNAIDLDYSSLYPSIIREFNIAPNTQIGMLIIPGKSFNQLEYARSNNTVAGAFMEDMQSQVWLEIGTRWFNLADYTTLYHEVEEFFTKVLNPIKGLKIYNRKGLIQPMTFYNKNLLVSPVEFIDNREEIKDKYIEPDISKWKELRQNAIEHPNQRF